MLLGSLLVLLVLVCIALGTVILLQRSEGGALGMGGGPSGFMTARGAGDLLTRITSILAGVFFVLCLLLTLLSGRLHTGGSVVDRLKVDSINPDALNRAMRPAGPAPTSGATPAAAVGGAAAGGSAADIGAVTPAPGAARPGGASFEAPRPEVHTAPAAPAGSTPAADRTHGHTASLLGVQTAPHSAPTVAPFAPKPPPAAAAAPPSTPAPGNSSGQ